MSWRCWCSAIALAGALALGGCAGPATVPAGPPPVVMAKFSRRLADGRLEVAANVRNDTAKPMHAKVGCRFDGSTAPVWREIDLAPGEVGTVRFDAPNPLPASGEIVF